MAKVVNCRQVGMDCDFEVRGETEQEIMRKCAEHAKSAHGKEMSQELTDKVRKAMREDPSRKHA